MLRFILLILIFIVFSSCASGEKKSITFEQIHITTDGNDGSLLVQVKNDLLKLKIINMVQYFNTIAEHISQLNISSRNCSRQEIACVFPRHKKTIFVSHNFFNMPWHERIGTLLHEIKHHTSDNYTHIKCTSTLITNANCDPNSDGPFGEELAFYQNLLKISFSKKLAKQIKKTFDDIAIRINNFNK